MMLLTKADRTKLLNNGSPANRDRDHIPVVKFFGGGACTWLISEMDPDGDTLFGLCDLGQGSPELGNVSLTELSAVRFRFGLGVERDRYWTGQFPLSVYTEVAQNERRIVDGGSKLAEIALAKQKKQAHDAESGSMS